MAFKSASPDKAHNFEEVEKAFRTAVIKTIHLEEVRRMVMVPVPSPEKMKELSARGTNIVHPLYPYSSTQTNVISIPIEEYADYSNTDENEAIDKAEKLGVGCGVLYNALVKNALNHRSHKVVWDLLANRNLKFMYVINNQPSIADPLAIIHGWVAFRFLFASSNNVEHLLSLDSSETQKAVESYRNGKCVS